jgi:hypothetical protein
MQTALWVGLVAHISNLALQDTIASELRRLMLLGHAILKGTPGADRDK